MSKKIVKSMAGSVKSSSKTSIAPLKKGEDLKGTRTGVVESDKRTKTRTVVVAFQTMHPKYGKYLKNRTVLHVHDEKNESHTGDVVEVAQCRPISKTKQWRLVRIVEHRAELAAAIASVKEVQ
jgi:small subunit ribosomal protein S17